MTPDQVERFMNSGGFKAYLVRDLFHHLGEEFERRLDAGELFTVEQPAKHFNLPFEVFRILFTHYLAALKIQAQSRTRH